MDEIYSCATLTIIGASLCCANACLPGVMPNTRPKRQHSEVVNGIRYVTGQPYSHLAIHRKKWSSRGWTFQEGFLSRRCLIFTSYQVYFMCLLGSRCEDTCEGGPGKEMEQLGTDIFHLIEPEGLNRECLFTSYAPTVENYSRRSFTTESDAVWAFNGVSKAFESQFADKFSWGLPSQNLDAGLLWAPRRLRGSHEERTGQHRLIIEGNLSRLPFPSWSWVSQ
jgi:hypothetical protein